MAILGARRRARFAFATEYSGGRGVWLRWSERWPAKGVLGYGGHTPVGATAAQREDTDVGRLSVGVFRLAVAALGRHGGIGRVSGTGRCQGRLGAARALSAAAVRSGAVVAGAAWCSWGKGLHRPLGWEEGGR